MHRADPRQPQFVEFARIKGELNEISAAIEANLVGAATSQAAMTTVVPCWMAKEPRDR